MSSTRRLLRSSSSNANSGYWFEDDPAFSLPRRKSGGVVGTDKENDAEVDSSFSTGTKATVEKKNNRIIRKNNGGRTKSLKRSGVSGATKKEDIYKNRKVPEYLTKCVIPSGMCKEVVITAEDMKLWKPISAQIQSTVWKIISHATRIVDRDLTSNRDKRELSGVFLTKVKNELALASAPPTEPLVYVESGNSSDLEDPLKAVPMDLNHQPLEISDDDLPLRQSHLPKQQNDLPLRQSNLPKQQNDLFLRQSNLPKQQNDLPLRQSNLPKQQNDLPLRQSNMPKQQNDLPLRQSNLLKEQNDVSLRQSSLSKQQNHENDLPLCERSEEHCDGTGSITEASSRQQIQDTGAGVMEWENETKESFIKYLLDLLQEERSSL